VPIRNNICKKGVSDLSVKTISTWICKTISLAYESSGQVILDKFQVKAHDVRALASSWALFNNASLNEVLSAGFWRGESSYLIKTNFTTINMLPS
jgi:hypothetical protein